MCSDSGDYCNVADFYDMQPVGEYISDSFCEADVAEDVVLYGSDKEECGIALEEECVLEEECGSALEEENNSASLEEVLEFLTRKKRVRFGRFVDKPEKFLDEADDIFMHSSLSSSSGEEDNFNLPKQLQKFNQKKRLKN